MPIYIETTPPVEPPTISALPVPPSTNSPSDFDAKADAFLGALPPFCTQENTLADNIFDNAARAYANTVNAANSASTALSAAATAVSSSGAPAWNPVTNYAANAAVYSPQTRMIYRRKVAGSGVLDPSLDGANWWSVDTSPAAIVVAATSVQAYAGQQYILNNPAPTTVTLPAAPNDGDTVWVTIGNAIGTNIIARNGKTIVGLAEDMVIDYAYLTLRLRYLGSTWRIV